MRLADHIYRTVTSVAGPLIFVQKVMAARIGEAVRIEAGDGRKISGEVLEIKGDTVLIELYGETRGLRWKGSRWSFRMRCAGCRFLPT